VLIIIFEATAKQALVILFSQQHKCATVMRNLMDVVQFRYNQSFAYSTIILLCILLGILVFRTSQFNGEDFTILFCFDSFFFLLVLLVLIKYLIPAIRKKTALELNEHSIVDLIRNRSANWDNVSGVRLIRIYRVLTPGIAVDLIDKNLFWTERTPIQKLISKISDVSYKTPFIIPLQYISGDTAHIFETVKDYQHRYKKNP